MSTSRILYAEDDATLAFLTKDNLEQNHYEVTHCCDGKTGMEIFKKGDFDICILDIMMPKMDGFELATEIRKVNIDIPIIFLSAKTLKEEAATYKLFSEEEKNIQIVMSILSNYVPNCVVRAEVSCKVEELADKRIENPHDFAEKFLRAVQIAEVEPFRAVTHNKGIMNGIDAVVLATGNDFRAVEAGVHAYASRNGQYSSLSHAKIENDIFSFWIEIPLALGTVGGLTSLHPLVKFSLEMLGKPNAKELMQIVAVAGLAQNFAALRSLTTTGIQEGHMKMHLNNILNQFEATEEERKKITSHFQKNTISHAAVVDFIENLRK